MDPFTDAVQEVLCSFYTLDEQLVTASLMKQPSQHGYAKTEEELRRCLRLSVSQIRTPLLKLYRDGLLTFVESTKERERNTPREKRTKRRRATVVEWRLNKRAFVLAVTNKIEAMQRAIENRFPFTCTSVLAHLFRTRSEVQPGSHASSPSPLSAPAASTRSTSCSKTRGTTSCCARPAIWCS